MARKSKFRHISAQQEIKLKIYKTGAYVRLSVLDGHKESSDSIENQEAMLRAYIANDPSLSLHCVYTDNGETGVNFVRDDFERLLDDIRIGNVDCVIVKDLSRFGRNYIEAGEYLEKVFPFMGVRFISINDGYDSLDPSTLDSLTIHLKNLVNDIYARDISQKICPVLRGKQERGEFIGAWAAYGYLKDPKDKHRLIVDEETAPIVRDIFRWRLSGMSYQNIARELNRRDIPSPSRYRFETGMVKDKRFANTVWKIAVIKSMLSNEVYLGHMVQGRKQAALWKGQEQTYIPKEQWIVVKDTHEAIVADSLFSSVHQLNEQMTSAYYEKQTRFAEVVNTENILKGLVCCGDCGTNLVRYKNVRENKHKIPKFHVWYSYICPVHATDADRCSFISIPETELLETVFGVIQSQLMTALDMEKLIQSTANQSTVLSQKQKIKQRIEQTRGQLDRVARLRESLCDDYLDRLMDEKDYLYAQNRYKEQEAELAALLSELSAQEQSIIETRTEENPWLRTLLPFREDLALTRKMALELVDQIIVHSKTSLTVNLRFEDEYRRLQESLLFRVEVAVDE